MKKKLLVLIMGLAMGVTACAGKTEIAEVTSTQQENSNGTQVGAQDGSGQSQETPNDKAQENTAQEGAAQQTGTAQQAKLLEGFLKGEAAAKVDDNFLNLLVMYAPEYKEGSSYTLDQLVEQLRGLDEYGGLGEKEPVITYAMLQNKPGDDEDERGMAVAIEFQPDYDTFRFIYVLNEEDGELELKLAIDSWSRNWVSVNNYGVVEQSGSGGAAYHIGAVYVPDEFTYQELEHWAEVGVGFTFDPTDGDKVETVNTIITEWAEQAADNESFYDVVFAESTIGDKAYYTYFAPDEAMQNKIDELAAKYNFRFDAQDAVDAAKAERAKLLDAESIYESHDEVSWTRL